ncbi:P-loop containing nucleoside triphosphate hydrolase protein, partial [Mycena polygramma]
LPPEPKIFYGREPELTAIVSIFTQESPRVALLGAGGIGKTSVARALLHHPDITAKFGQHRVFIACDSVANKVELAALIGAHLGLMPRRDLTRAVVQHFSDAPPSLLILDNLETLWEPTQSRQEIEEFLSLLTDVDHLALLITMRGLERPGKVRWTRPFIPPLERLAQDAARKMFIDIADDNHDLGQIDKVLSLTDNVPLAISLLAHLVDSEGCTNILSRWEVEKTSLLSEGYDRRSNLDLSISISLTSPRITSTPDSQELLGLLSVLPDGLSDVELLQTKLPIRDIPRCKLALIRTALAYVDGQKRLKVLVPIREYMQRNYPLRNDMVRPLLTYFQDLLKVYLGSSSSRAVPRIISNYANIQNVIQHGL